MKNAQALAGKHVTQIAAIKALPVVPEAGQCDAIIQEQKDYVAARKRGRVWQVLISYIRSFDHH
jgi:hypothetical protein